MNWRALHGLIIEANNLRDKINAESGMGFYEASDAVAYLVRMYASAADPKSLKAKKPKRGGVE